MAGEEGCKVVFGFDAHDVDAAYDGESLKRAEKLVEKYNLDLVEYPEIKDVRKILRKGERGKNEEVALGSCCRNVKDVEVVYNLV